MANKEKLEKLRNLADSIEDSYEGFALCLSVVARAENLIDEAIDFIEGREGVSTEEVIDYLDLLIDEKNEQ